MEVINSNISEVEKENKNSIFYNTTAVSNDHYTTLTDFPKVSDEDLRRMRIENNKIKESLNKQKKQLEVSPNYSYGALPSFAKDTEFNKKDSFLIFSKDEEESTLTEFIKTNWNKPIKYDQFNRYAPLVRVSDFTIKDMQCYFIINNPNGPTHVTLPNASDWPHYWNYKEIILKNLQNHPILSNDNNIQQLNSKEISNNILPAESGKYVTLITNGKRWIIKSID